MWDTVQNHLAIDTMYKTCIDVIFAVGIALMSLQYLSVIITTNEFHILSHGNGTYVLMGSYSSGLAVTQRFSYS